MCYKLNKYCPRIFILIIKSDVVLYNKFYLYKQLELSFIHSTNKFLHKRINNYTTNNVLYIHHRQYD